MAEVLTEIDFPYLVTFVAGFLAFLLGMVWYHPKVLGTKWIEERGKTMADVKPEPLPFAVSFLLWMVASVFFTFLVGFHDVDTAPGLFCLSSLLWVAFAMPPTLMGALYTGYPFGAVAIDSAYQLAGYYVFAAVHLGFVVFI